MLKKLREKTKMEQQNELQMGIGTEEATSLKPAKVKIGGVKVEEVGTKKAKKLICVCKHPDKAEDIHLSAVKYENKGKLEVSGLWVNKDSQGLIRKGSALAVFLTALGSSNIDSLRGKEVETAMDEKGYLCFKAY